MIAKVPELEYCDYVFELWGKIGMCSSGVSGAIPLSWGVINDWCTGNGLDLWPTERALIVKLSESYVEQLNKSDDPRELPPIAIMPDGDIDYGVLGQMHMAGRDHNRKTREEKQKKPL